MRTISIDCKSGESYYSREISIQSIFTFGTSFVNLINYFKTKEEGDLIQLKHNQQITSLNVTEVFPYILLFFNDDLIYKGASYSLKSTTGGFIIQTQYKNILFLKLPHNLQLNIILNLNL